jgi:hypothetical protein
MLGAVCSGAKNRDGKRGISGLGRATEREARGLGQLNRLYFTIAQIARKPSRQPIFFPSA